MTTLSAFLPIDRRVALAEGRELPDRAEGAALFADISGFTPLTATMRRELGARRGAEELIRHLDAVFAELIARIHRYHGNVIGFSGDAITCWFDDATPEEGATAAGQAAAAAFAMQEYMTRLEAITTPGGTRIPMAVKIAVAAGPARRFLVGDPRIHVIEVIAGRTVDRTSTAEKLAERGEVILSAEVLPLLNRPPAVVAWRAAGDERYAVVAATAAAEVAPPAPRIPPAVDDEVARPWLLPPIYEDLRQGAAEFLAELRPALPLFVRFSGIDYDADDDAGSKLDTFVRRAQVILEHYEGFLGQITIGDKGSYLYITFGAPVAHEDDDARAAAAALELLALPDELPFLDPIHIGISRGLIHSGAYGGPERRTFSVMGKEVNVAARLMTAAQPGQILLSERVATAVAGEFDVVQLPPITLKGMTEQFAVSELRARRAVAHGPHHPLAGTSIGRAEEQAALEEALSGPAAGQSSTLIIEGAAGMGKSLLMNELAARAAARPEFIVLMGFGDAIERSTPYFSWRPVFETLLGAGDRHDPAWRDRVIERLDPAARPLAPLLNAVLPLDLPESDLTGQLSGEARLDNTHQLLLDVLRSATAGRLPALLFDDVHWMDSLSWSLLDRARRELAPLLVGLGSRPFGDDAPAIFSDLRSASGTRLIVLDALPPEAIEQLVCRRLGVRRLPPEVARLIREKAEGHPFFSEELAYALRDAGLLRVDGEEARLAPGANLAELDFPTTIQGVITSRIDRLSPSQQLTAKVASVIGRIFAVSVLGGVYPIEGGEGQLRANLQRLERLDITSEETPDPDLSYIFKHIATQEVVYSLMTFAQRAQLHRSTAQWYEARPEGVPASNYPLLAHHWRLAGEAEKAVGYYEQAGENAFRDFANREAVSFFEAALELAGENAPAVRRARWRRLLGEARYRLTQVEGSMTDYNAALALLGRPVPHSTGGRGAGLGLAMFRQLAHRAAPRRFVGSTPADRRETMLEASRTLEGLAENYYNTGDFLATFYCTMTAFNLAEQVGPSPELMRGYANMCGTMGTVSLNSAADGYRRRTLALEPQIDDLPARAWSRVSLASQSVWVGAWDRAEQEIGESLAIYRQLGDWRRWGVAAWLLPQVAQSRGQLERARDLWAELYAVAARNRDTRHEVRGGGGQFFNFLALGRPDDARICLERMRAAMDDNPEMMPVEERLWHAANAAWAMVEGDRTRARQCADETLAAIGRARFKFDLLEIFATPAEVFLALWEQGDAAAVEAQAACKVLSGYSRTYAFARPRALRAQGRYARLAGNPKKAAKLLEKSRAQADALRMPLERALTEELQTR